MTISWTRWNTGPLGPLTIAARDGALVALWFGDPERRPDGPNDHRDPVLAQARSQLQEWLDGRRTRFDLPLRPEGTAFQRAVWSELQRIPHGETRSYADVARAIGRPGAVRAVGAANARNPLWIVVPCHRVIGSDGSLTGYAGGVETKRWLLAHERGGLNRGHDPQEEGVLVMVSRGPGERRRIHCTPCELRSHGDPASAGASLSGVSGGGAP